MSVLEPDAPLTPPRAARRMAPPHGGSAAAEPALGVRWARWGLPILTLAVALFAWEWAVRANDVPSYVLPAPSLVARTLVEDWPILLPALATTAWITALAFATAALGGIALGVLLAASRVVSMSLYPFAVVMQVTPVVAIAPIIFIWAPKTVGLVLCAWLVAFFPVLSGTVQGLRSVDPGLRDLFTVHGASWWQRLTLLRAPSALPSVMGGLRVAGGLALIGAVVAELVAGTGGVGSGLAWRILEAGYRLDVARMFAALVLVAALGVMIHAALSWITRASLRDWHDSEA